MEQDFCSDIVRQVMKAVEEGSQAFVYWGVNTNTLCVLSELNRLGLLESYTTGIIDPDPRKQSKRIHGIEVLPPERVQELDVDTLVIAQNRDKELSLRQYVAHDPRLPKVIISGIEHISFRDPVFDALLASCLVPSFATGYANSLIHIYQSIKYLADSNIKGHVAEFGIFKGGTTVFVAKTLQHFGFTDTKVYGFDIFEGFPPSRTVLDMYAHPDCEFHDFDAVTSYCEQNGVEVIKGDICETYRQLESVPLMLSFFDTDNYSPTRAALNLCYEQTVQGGVLAFDHFVCEGRHLYTIGERMAVDEVLSQKKVFNLHGTGIFIKLPIYDGS